MRRSEKCLGLALATAISVLLASGPAFSTEQSTIAPVAIEDAVVQATLEGCVPIVLGRLSVDKENASQLSSAGLIPIEEENGFADLPVVPLKDLHKRGIATTNFAVRPALNGRVILGATPRLAYCGIVILGAPAEQAREKLLTSIKENGWALERGGTVGDIESFSSIVDGEFIRIGVTGRERASASDAGYRLSVSVARTKD